MTALRRSMDRWAKRLKRDGLALWIAARDPRTPWYAKAVAGAVAAYVFSPIDPLPNFIPVVGWLDEGLIIPLGVLLAAKLIPPGLFTEFRAEAAARADQPTSRWAAAGICVIWVAGSALTGWVIWNWIG